MVYQKMEDDVAGDEDAQQASRASAQDEALLSTAAPLPVHLWQSVEGVHAAAVTSLAISSDGATVFTGSGACALPQVLTAKLSVFHPSRAFENEISGYKWTHCN